MSEIGEIYVKINGRLDDLEKKLDDAKASSKKKGGDAGKGYGDEFGNKLRETMKRVGPSLNSVIGGIGVATLVKGAVDKTIDLENAMAKVKVNANATASEMKMVSKAAEGLSEKHKDLGRTTADYTKAMLESVWAGQKLDQAMKSSEASINLAGAAQMGVAESSQVVSNALNVFRLDAAKAAMVSDVLATASGKASGSLLQMVQGFQQGSAIAAQAGLNVEDLATALGLMANNGILGSDAGTSLKSMLLQLMNPTKQATAYIKNMQERTKGMGGEFYDAKGKMKPFIEIIAELSRGLQGLTDKQKNKVLGELFGSDGIRGALVMLKEGEKGFANFKNGLNTTGQAAKLAEGNIGDTTKMINALSVDFDKFSRESAKDVVKVFRELLGVGQDALKMWRDMNPAVKDAITHYGIYALALKPVISGIKAIIDLKSAFVAGEIAKTAAMKLTEAQAIKTAEAQTAVSATTASGITGKAVLGFIGGRLLPMGAILTGTYLLTKDNSLADPSGGNLGQRGSRSAASEEMLQIYESVRKYKTEAEQFEAFKKGIKSIAGKDIKFAPGYFDDSKKAFELQERIKMYQSTLGAAATGSSSPPLFGSSAGAAGGSTGGLDADGNLINSKHKKDVTTITKAIIEAMAGSIKTPDNEASCAYFASMLLKGMGDGVEKTGGAKAFIDKLLGHGGVRVDRKEARAGDLVYYHGPNVGAKGNRNFWEDGIKGGYHVGVYNGDGTVTDSSGDGSGHVRKNRPLGPGAHFVRPKLSGKFDNVGDIALKNQDTWDEIQKAMAEEAQRISDSLEPIRRMQNANKSNKMRKSGSMLMDVIAMREFGKNYYDLTDEANRNKVKGMTLQEGTDARNKEVATQYANAFGKGSWSKAGYESYTANAEAVKSYTDILQKQLEKELDLSAVETAKLEIKRRGLILSTAEYDGLIKLAQAKDDDNKKDKEKAEKDKAIKAMDEHKTEGLKQYAEAMRNLGDRTAELGHSAEVNEFRLRKFALSFAGGSEEVAKSADVMLKAKNYMKELAKVEDLERMKAMFSEVADSMVTPIRDALSDLLRMDMPDFLRSFGSMIDNALRDIAHKVIEFQIRLQLNNLMGSIFGKIFGSALGSLGAGNGYTGYSGDNNIPDGGGDGSSSNGLAMRNSATSNMSSGGGNVYITINATDAASVIGSKDQVALALSQSVQDARRKF